MYMTTIRRRTFMPVTRKEIQVGIADGRVTGEFPHRAKVLVLEWWNLRREELEANWQLLADGKEPQPIAPLE